MTSFWLNPSRPFHPIYVDSICPHQPWTGLLFFFLKTAKTVLIIICKDIIRWFYEMLPFISCVVCFCHKLDVSATYFCFLFVDIAQKHRQFQKNFSVKNLTTRYGRYQWYHFSRTLVDMSTPLQSAPLVCPTA